MLFPVIGKEHYIMRIFTVALLCLPVLGFSQTDTLKALAPDTSKVLAAPDTVPFRENLTPSFSISAGELENDNQSQDVSGILHSSRDAFTSVSGFTFSQARYRFRYYNSANTLVYINGVRMNDPETGIASYSSWGGLNDIMRFSDTRTGIAPFRFGFSGIGGATSIDTRPSLFKKGGSVSYAYSNRLYDHRMMVALSSGLMDNGWAFTGAGSRRYSTEGYIPGTFMESWSYYLGAEKKINAKHSVFVTAFGTPTKQGRQGTATQEAYDLAGDHYYNPLWGYQTTADGSEQKIRNSRVSKIHEPIIIASHIWKRSTVELLQTSLFYTFGRNGVTSLNWYDAKDPRPDYYRYMPSYFANTDTVMMNSVKQNWLNDRNVRQVNWDQLYFANSKNLYTVFNANGTGATVEGKRSKYILEEVRADQKVMGFTSTYQKNLKENLNLSASISGTKSKTHNFKVMNDLLGGDFWVDVDQFAEQSSTDTTKAQNDLSTPNKVVKVGDQFGFDYNILDDQFNSFVQAEWSLSKFDVYGSVTGQYTTFKRVGNVQNGRFPEESIGESESFNFFNYGAKAGVTYKISGRHYVSTNGVYLNRPPLPRNIYIAPRSRSRVVNNVESEKVMSGDLNYIVRYPKVKGRATVFYTEINDQTVSNSFYHDEFRTFVNYTTTGVDQLFMGAEIGAEVNILPELLLTVVGTKGDALFKSRPIGTITQDNSDSILAIDKTLYLKNYHVGGMPEAAYSAGLKYSGKKYWFAGLSFNYYDEIYVQPNPDRRSEEAVDKYVNTDPQVEQILGQEQLKSGYTIDFFGGKSWRFKGKYIGLNLNVSNILNNTDFKMTGFEQLRYDANQIDKFPSKYSYHFGRTFYAMLSFRF
jgi:hypothetical protein